MEKQQILDQVLRFLTAFFGKDEKPIELPVEGPALEPMPQLVAVPEVAPSTGIDWANRRSMLSKHFTVGEALYLPSWKAYHIPSEDEKANLIRQAQNMDKIREFLGVSINVHCWIRPVLNNPDSPHHGEDYNAFVKGAKSSSHKIGLATDYDAKGLTCDDVRAKLEEKLEEFGMRMERMPGGNWVHNDSADVSAGGHRFFIP